MSARCPLYPQKRTSIRQSIYDPHLATPMASADNETRLGAPMREWLLMLIPFALVLYFVIFPDQFGAAFHWLGQLFFQ
jgi:hypothetical protein